MYLMSCQQETLWSDICNSYLSSKKQTPSLYSFSSSSSSSSSSLSVFALSVLRLFASLWTFMTLNRDQMGSDFVSDLRDYSRGLNEDYERVDE
ncbi:hypothetical protein QVD17_09688 [Tagetes erecta]|uniref:Uncharacterized protein n=1 Tax=Tagetes erecta TaxID=13708 RepID=A0AAD8L4A7_TARER|nr:hypothetical protein QVD17_09688 [Tagetes erecta]